MGNYVIFSRLNMAYSFQNCKKMPFEKIHKTRTISWGGGNPSKLSDHKIGLFWTGKL